MPNKTHGIRIYRGDTIIGQLNIDGKYWSLFNEYFSHRDGRLEPCINMLDESSANEDGSWDHRYEFSMVMHFDLLAGNERKPDAE